MQNVVPFPEKTGFVLAGARLDRVREKADKAPLGSLARAAQRAYVRAVVAQRKRQEQSAAELLYFAAFCFARLAEEGGLGFDASARVVSFTAKS